MSKKVPFKFLIITIVLIVIFLPSFAKYQALLARNRSLERQIKYLQEEAKKLQEEKMRLETDITYVEQRAREKIGVAKRGEFIMKETPAKK